MRQTLSDVGFWRAIKFTYIIAFIVSVSASLLATLLVGKPTLIEIGLFIGILIFALFIGTIIAGITIYLLEKSS